MELWRERAEPQFNRRYAADFAWQVPPDWRKDSVRIARDRAAPRQRDLHAVLNGVDVDPLAAFVSNERRRRSPLPPLEHPHDKRPDLLDRSEAVQGVCEPLLRRQHPRALEHPAAAPLQLFHLIKLAGRMHSHQVGNTGRGPVGKNRRDTSSPGLSVELQRLVRDRPERDVAIVDTGADRRSDPGQDGIVCRDVYDDVIALDERGEFFLVGAVDSHRRCLVAYFCR